MYPLSFTFYGELMNALIMVPLEASAVVRVISMFIVFIAISAILAFLERYCLSVFAGTISPRYWCDYSTEIMTRVCESESASDLEQWPVMRCHLLCIVLLQLLTAMKGERDVPESTRSNEEANNRIRLLRHTFYSISLVWSSLPSSFWMQPLLALIYSSRSLASKDHGKREWVLDDWSECVDSKQWSPNWIPSYDNLGISTFMSIQVNTLNNHWTDTSEVIPQSHHLSKWRKIYQWTSSFTLTLHC